MSNRWKGSKSCLQFLQSQFTVNQIPFILYVISVYSCAYASDVPLQQDFILGASKYQTSGSTRATQLEVFNID
ncbi:hypothetical protein ACOSQ3_025934 [Xanthoceras sorbifolium]